MTTIWIAKDCQKSARVLAYEKLCTCLILKFLHMYKHFYIVFLKHFFFKIFLNTSAWKFSGPSLFQWIICNNMFNICHLNIINTHVSGNTLVSQKDSEHLFPLVHNQQIQFNILNSKFYRNYFYIVLLNNTLIAFISC